MVLKWLLQFSLFCCVFSGSHAQTIEPPSGQFSEISSFNDLSVDQLLIRSKKYLLRDTKLDSAEWWLALAQERLSFTKNDTLAGEYYYQRGELSFFRQEMKAALDNFRKSILIYEGIGDSTQWNYAEAYRRSAETGMLLTAPFSRTVDDYQHAIKLYEYQGDTVNYLWSVHNLAQHYGNNGFYKLAAQERKAVFRYSGTKKFMAVRAAAHLVAAIEEKLQGKDRLMLEELAKSKELLERLPEQRILAYFLERFYLGYYYLNEVSDSARVHYQAIEKQMEVLGKAPRFQDHFRRDRAMWYYLTGRLVESKVLAEQSLQAAKTRGEVRDVERCLGLLRRINEGLDNHEAALGYAVLEMQLSDSLAKAAKITQTNFFENLYEKEKNAVLEAKQAAKAALIEQRMEDRQRTTILWASLGLIVLSALFLIWAFLNVRKRKRMQTLFSRDLIMHLGEERKRIARDIHDRLGHDLLLLKKNLLVGQSVGENERVSTVDRVMKDVRLIAHQLYDLGPDELGFNLAVGQLVERFDSGTKMFFSLELTEEEPQLTVEQKQQLFAITQEGLQNIVKHARARAASVKFFEDGSTYTLMIADNGVGMKNRSIGDGKGIGLRSMRERANMIGADFKLESTPAKGTTITITI